jgi:transcriptional regulator with PAS, ATPase and Fis domain
MSATGMAMEGKTLKTRLESLVEEMVERGILFEDACREFERHYIEKVMQRNNNNLSRASAELRIHRNTLAKRLRALAPKSR